MKDRKVKSFDKFVAELQRSNPQQIGVQANRWLNRGWLESNSRLPLVGFLGNFTHGLVYLVSTATRDDRFVEGLFTTFQSEHGIGDAERRNRLAIKALLAAEVRVEYLRGELPDTAVFVANEHGSPMPLELLEKLHEDATLHGVESPI